MPISEGSLLHCCGDRHEFVLSGSLHHVASALGHGLSWISRGVLRVMELPVASEKRFVCVKFPGIVENIDKALNCLGGQETINKVKAKCQNVLFDFIV